MTCEPRCDVLSDPDTRARATVVFHVLSTEPDDSGSSTFVEFIENEPDLAVSLCTLVRVAVEMTVAELRVSAWVPPEIDEAVEAPSGSTPSAAMWFAVLAELDRDELASHDETRKLTTADGIVDGVAFLARVVRSSRRHRNAAVDARRDVGGGGPVG